MLTVVAVHGLWHDPWCWDPVRARLDAIGLPSLAPRLPLTSLRDDAAAVGAALDDCPGPVLLVGHSYGGAVVTACGAHPAVARLAYLAAFQLDTGESVSRVLPDLAIPDTDLPAALRRSADGTQIGIDPEAARALLYHDVPPALADEAVGRLRPVGRALFRDVPTVIGWRERPASYLVCGQDRVVNPALQRAMATRSQDVREWDCGHLPLLSRPDELASLLATLARADQA